MSRACLNKVDLMLITVHPMASYQKYLRANAQRYFAWKSFCRCAMPINVISPCHTPGIYLPLFPGVGVKFVERWLGPDVAVAHAHGRLGNDEHEHSHSMEL